MDKGTNLTFKIFVDQAEAFFKAYASGNSIVNPENVRNRTIQHCRIDLEMCMSICMHIGRSWYELGLSGLYLGIDGNEALNFPESKTLIFRND